MVAQGYKQTEVGVIPDDWEVVQLCDISNLKSGKSITSDNIFNIGDYKCFGGNGLRGYTNTYTHNGKFPLIGRQGALCGNINYTDEKFFASEHAVVVTVKNNISPKWLYYVLTRMNLNQYSESSAQPGLSVSKINILPIPYPIDKSEQTAIATALSDMDSLISSLESLIAKKRNIKQGAMTTLLSPKEGWEVKRLGEVCISIISGKSNTKSISGAYPIYGSTGIIGTKNFNDYEGDKILVARVGANAGSVNKVKGKYCVSDNTLMITLFNNIDLDFIFFTLISFQLNKLVFGSGQPLITGSQLKMIDITLPSFEKQTRIANILSDMDNEIAALETKLEKYKQIKQGMMTNLLTGKIRLV